MVQRGTVATDGKNYAWREAVDGLFVYPGRRSSVGMGEGTVDSRFGRLVYREGCKHRDLDVRLRFRGSLYSNRSSD